MPFCPVSFRYLLLVVAKMPYVFRLNILAKLDLQVAHSTDLEVWKAQLMSYSDLGNESADTQE